MAVTAATETTLIRHSNSYIHSEFGLQATSRSGLEAVRSDSGESITSKVSYLGRSAVKTRTRSAIGKFRATRAELDTQPSIVRHVSALKQETNSDDLAGPDCITCSDSQQLLNSCYQCAEPTWQYIANTKDRHRRRSLPTRYTRHRKAWSCLRYQTKRPEAK